MSYFVVQGRVEGKNTRKYRLFMPVYKLGVVGWWGVKESRVSDHRQKRKGKKPGCKTIHHTWTQRYTGVRMTVIVLGSWKGKKKTDYGATHVLYPAGIKPLCTSSGEDLHSASGRSTDKLPRQPQETEGRKAAWKVSHSSGALSGASPTNTPYFHGLRDAGGRMETGRPGGHGRTVPPWGQEWLEDQCPPWARPGPLAPGLSFTDKPLFFQSKIPTEGNGPKVLLTELNYSQPEMSRKKLRRKKSERNPFQHIYIFNQMRKLLAQKFGFKLKFICYFYFVFKWIKINGISVVWLAHTI